MIRASALYMVVVIALVIGLLCSSLVVVAYYYRLQDQKMSRIMQLQTNLSSGVAILLASQDISSNTEEKTFSLFGGDRDTVSIKKIPWGGYEVGAVRAMIQKDTLYKTFTIANEVDSSKWGVLYLADEDRPVSVSGKSVIKGDAYLPQAGAKAAYINNAAYEGDKNIVTGKIHNSNKTIPALDTKRLSQIEHLFDQPVKADTNLVMADSVKNSFLAAAHVFDLRRKAVTLSNIKLEGNIVLHSDTSIIIEPSATLNQVIITAKYIHVKAGFQGTCQLFATDSLTIEKNCNFFYPSCIGLHRLKSYSFSVPPHIFIGEQTQVQGLVFGWDKNFNAQKAPIITLAKNVTIAGQVYSQGYVELNNGVMVKGNLTTKRFLYQSGYTRYENYIINTKLDETQLSRYYLTSDLMPVSSSKRKVLQWLESN